MVGVASRRLRHARRPSSAPRAGERLPAHGRPRRRPLLKMVHNGIEYGMMQASARASRSWPSPFALDLAPVAELWRQGSVVRSWLLELLGGAPGGPEARGIAAGWRTRAKAAGRCRRRSTVRARRGSRRPLHALPLARGGLVRTACSRRCATSSAAMPSGPGNDRRRVARPADARWAPPAPSRRQLAAPAHPRHRPRRARGRPGSSSRARSRGPRSAAPWRDGRASNAPATGCVGSMS